MSEKPEMDPIEAEKKVKAAAKRIAKELEDMPVTQEAHVLMTEIIPNTVNGLYGRFRPADVKGHPLYLPVGAWLIDNELEPTALFVPTNSGLITMQPVDVIEEHYNCKFLHLEVIDVFIKMPVEQIG